MAKVLIVSQGSAFLINSVENNLKKEGLQVVCCEPTKKDFDENIIDTDILLLFSGDFVKETPTLVSYISEKAALCKYFCIIGYSSELIDLEKMLDVSLISAEFKRPFDVKDFVYKIKALAFEEFGPDGIKDKDAEEELGEKKKHILLCDDDIMFLKMVQEWLKDKYRVTIVKSGLMAIPFAANNQPDLILLDFEMPIMSGARVLEELRDSKKTSKIPVVFLTGHSDKDSVMSVMELKPQGYMLKATKKEDIIASID
nr:response regulator [Clostridiales bacterium]